MIWLFIGVGIFVFLGAVAGDDVRWIGLIPGGVGLAYLLYHLIEGRHEKRLDVAGPGSTPAPVRGD
jgi:hypothetical protein